MSGKFGELAEERFFILVERKDYALFKKVDPVTAVNLFTGKTEIIGEEATVKPVHFNPHTLQTYLF